MSDETPLYAGVKAHDVESDTLDMGKSHYGLTRKFFYKRWFKYPSERIPIWVLNNIIGCGIFVLYQVHRSR